ncbi:MAG: hypothetical protein V3U90_03450 [Dehalococcoidia bacterium]
MARRTSGGLTLYYDPLTSERQLSWILGSYDEALEILSSKFEISSLETTLYLLSGEMYTEVYSGSHPEWTQGFAQGTEIYVNRYAVRVWDVSVTAQERIAWVQEHIQEIMERATAHELTHAALDSWQLPRWVDEGLAEHIESLIAPDESAQKQLLQRRYLVRDALARDAVPTEAQLVLGDWISVAGNDEELFGLLYDISFLIVQRVADTSGDQGLRGLLEAGDLEMPLADFIDTELQQWLLAPLPEEMAAPVLCGLNDMLVVRDQIVSEWNAQINEPNVDFAYFKERYQQLIDSLDSLPADTIVEDVRLKYIDSYSQWLTAIDAYIQKNYSLGNFHLRKSNNLEDEAFQLFSNAWDEYIVVSCELVEGQLQ